MTTSILFLGPEDSPIAKWLAGQGEHVHATMESLTVRNVSAHKAEWLISHGYRHIVRREILALFPGKAVNLHISLLPWNRGADPNLWSFVDDTPKGVTIHLMDEGVDTGDIIAQREIVLEEDQETLATSYEKLQAAIGALFCETWPLLKSGSVTPVPQPAGGTSHRVRDKEPLLRFLSRGWDTPVAELRRVLASHQHGLREEHQ